MVDVLNFDEHWSHYNDFHFTGTERQFNRIVSHYELYNLARDVPGEIVECGVFKGPRCSGSRRSGRSLGRRTRSN
jgi:hypothetical protein